MNKDNVYYPFFNKLEKLKEDGSYRFLRDIQKKEDKYIFFDNKKYINLASNDYLGLATDKILQDEFLASIKDEKFPEFSASSSRLLTGNSELYTELENEIATFHNKESSIVFNSGYHANIGILPALMEKGDLILSDKLNHASIIDGVRLCNADFMIYDHKDYNQLEKLLEKNRSKYDKIIIVSESVFSMDGDKADLTKLVQIKKRFETMLYIDEAHAVGVFGNNGCGLCEEVGVLDQVDIVVGTFGKALASLGAYAVIPKLLKDYLINFMRPFIFTTALSPFILKWNIFIIKKIPSLNDKRIYLKLLSSKLRESIKLSGGITKGDSQIIPIIIGENEKTLNIADNFLDSGIFALPIRPPSVPKGSSRIRISLSANIDWEDISLLKIILGENR